MKFQLKQHFHIESARKLPLLPPQHPCSQVHGHSFHIIVTLIGEKNNLGWVIDYNEIKSKLQPLLSKLDHKYLNEIIDNPTTENLCEFFFNESVKIIPQIKQITILETPQTECSYPIA